jgi:hypothetical protein
LVPFSRAAMAAHRPALPPPRIITSYGSLTSHLSLEIAC